MILSGIYDPTDGPLDLMELRIGATTEVRHVRISLPANVQKIIASPHASPYAFAGLFQVTNVAVTKDDILLMIEFVGGQVDPDDSDVDLLQAVLSQDGTLYPVRMSADGFFDGKIGRYSWDPERNAIVAHRRVPSDDGERLLIYMFDYIRAVAKVGEKTIKNVLYDIGHFQKSSHGLSSTGSWTDLALSRCSRTRMV